MSIDAWSKEAYVICKPIFNPSRNNSNMPYQTASNRGWTSPQSLKILCCTGDPYPRVYVDRGAARHGAMMPAAPRVPAQRSADGENRLGSHVCSMYLCPALTSFHPVSACSRVSPGNPVQDEYVRGSSESLPQGDLSSSVQSGCRPSCRTSNLVSLVEWNG